MKRVLAAALALGPGGCFVSEEPMIDPNDADFPYETITYREAASGKETTIVHEGDAYVVANPDSSANVEILFDDIGDGLYLAQLKNGTEASEFDMVYGVITVDFDKEVANSYMVFAPERMDGTGFKQCGDGMICIENLDVYLKLAREAIASGVEPDASYEIVSAE